MVCVFVMKAGEESTMYTLKELVFLERLSAKIAAFGEGIFLAPIS